MERGRIEMDAAPTPDGARGRIEMDPQGPQTTAPAAFLSKAAESVPIIGAGFNERVAGAETPDPAGTPLTERRHMEFDIPGLGPILRKAEERIGLVQPGLTRDEALKAQRALMAQRAEEHPIPTVAGKVAGTVAGYAALPAASMETLPAAMATNALVSGADTAARGGSLGETVGSAVGGAAGGALGFGAGRVAGGLLDKGADAAVRASAGKSLDLPAILQGLGGAELAHSLGHPHLLPLAIGYAVMKNPTILAHVLTAGSRAASALQAGGVPAIVGAQAGSAIGEAVGKPSGPTREERLRQLDEEEAKNEAAIAQLLGGGRLLRREPEPAAALPPGGRLLRRQ